MMGMAQGDHVAFITQDATLAHERWLAALLEGFEQADDVALVFGPHDPRAGRLAHDQVRDGAPLRRLGDGGTIDVQRLERTPEALAAYRGFPGRWSFFSTSTAASRAGRGSRSPTARSPTPRTSCSGAR